MPCGPRPMPRARPNRMRLGASLGRLQLTTRQYRPRGCRGCTPRCVVELRRANPPNKYRWRGRQIARQLSWDPIRGRRNRRSHLTPGECGRRCGPSDSPCHDLPAASARPHCSTRYERCASSAMLRVTVAYRAVSGRALLPVRPALRAGSIGHLPFGCAAPLGRCDFRRRSVSGRLARRARPRRRSRQQCHGCCPVNGTNFTGKS